MVNHTILKLVQKGEKNMSSFRSHIIEKISKRFSNTPCTTLRCLARTLALLIRSRFVTVVYDDFHGIKRPIGMIHRLRVRGQVREVFTFCCMGKRQPEMALFVRRRTGNLAEQIALSFEEQDTIPVYLKHLPDAYRDQYFKRFCLAC